MSLTTELICAHLRLKENGRQKLITNKINKKFIYLISPNKIKTNNFYTRLDQILSLKKISFFQLRLKKETNRNKISIGKKIKKICKRYKVKFIINDDPILAKKLNSDGCHLGQQDMKIKEARKILGSKKIIGMTCHNSKLLIKKAIKEKADYIALGSFFKTKTKKTKYRAKLTTLKWHKKAHNLPVVAIGGITDKNMARGFANVQTCKRADG